MSVPACRLDHLVVCARSLVQGLDWFENLSGVRIPAGGEHLYMGTHNHLSALSTNSYLEIIAINPQAPKPAHKRWFNLDNNAHQAQLASAPKLTTWVAATDDLDASLAIAKRGGIDLGTPVPLTRGDLQWRLALRGDGTLACDGVFPILIQWPDGINPVATMQDQGLRLFDLSASHPQSALMQPVLEKLGLAPLLTVKEGVSSLQASLTIGHHNVTL